MPTTTYTRPWITDYQKAAIFTRKRYAVVEATTKCGKTVGSMIWLAEQAMGGGPGKNYWWISPVLSQAVIVYRRLKRALPRSIYTFHDTEHRITLGTGATIWFKGADKPDSLYGEDVHAAVIDEATRCKEEAWHAIRTTLTATKGPVRIIGNVKGRRNWAYKMARRAESGSPGMHYAKITAADAVAAKILDQAEIDDARQQLPDAVFRELYLAEASDDEGNPFGYAAIESNVVAELSDQPTVCWGWDLAKSTDWTVGIGLDFSGCVSEFLRFQKPWNDTIDKIVLACSAPGVVDATGVGDPIVERLQALAPGQFEGFKFSATSKQQLMEGLAVAIQKHEVRYPDGPIKNELRDFEYVYTRTGVRYAAPPGFHDDCVDALALALSARGSVRAPGDLGIS